MYYYRLEIGGKGVFSNGPSHIHYLPITKALKGHRLEVTTGFNYKYYFTRLGFKMVGLPILRNLKRNGFKTTLIKTKLEKERERIKELDILQVAIPLGKREKSQAEIVLEQFF